MNTIKIKNLTNSVMLLGHGFTIKPEGELEIPFADYQKIASVVTSFFKSGWAKVSEGELKAAASNAETNPASSERRKEIKDELTELQKEFRNPKTVAARKEEIALLVNNLKEEAKSLK